jgi:hypothetical protein
MERGEAKGGGGVAGRILRGRRRGRRGEREGGEGGGRGGEGIVVTFGVEAEVELGWECGYCCCVRRLLGARPPYVALHFFWSSYVFFHQCPCRNRT